METWLDLNTVNLLGRVDSRINKNRLIKKIAKKYRLGDVISFRQIHEGFEDYNVRLKTEKGLFLVKVFSQFKSFRHVKDNVRGLVEFHKAGVRVPKLYKNSAGEYLFYYESRDANALACVTEYFEGKSFFKHAIEPTIAEMKDIVKDIVKINTVKFKPKGIYDVWVVPNLIPEFEKKKRFLSKEDLQLVKQSVIDVKTFDYSKCVRSTIHGDIQRSNVLKNSNGEIRIIDFSVMERNATVIELGVYLSLFCINPKITKPNLTLEIYKEIINEYLKHRKINPYGLKILPKLIRATYAVNNLAANYELRGKNNDSEETHYWIDLGHHGMKLSDKVLPSLEKVRF